MSVSDCKGLYKVTMSYYNYGCKANKYFELKNSWGANGAPQTRTTC